MLAKQIQLRTTQPKTAKSAIIQTLACEYPLITKKVYQVLQREHGFNITYQAIHKALQELEKDRVVIKIGRSWQLDQSWLDSQETFIQKTKQKYSGNKNHYNINLNYSGPQIFEFDNFTDFCVETAKLIADRKISSNGERTIFVMQYGWWPFKFKFEQLELLYKMVKKAPQSTSLIQQVTPFGKWIHQQYTRVAGKKLTKPIGKNVDISKDMFIQGEWIGQVSFSPESMKTIIYYWNKWKGLEDCFREFGLKEEPKMHIEVTITRNPELARFMKDELERHLNES